MDYKNTKVTLMGLGLYPQGSGVSALRFLYDQGAKITVTDTKTHNELEPQLRTLKKLKGVTYVLGQHVKGDFIDTDLVVKNPGVPASSPYLKIARAQKIPIATDTTLYFQNTIAPTIGVTGTRGKSTTSSLLFLMLHKKYTSTRLGGNIKISPLTFLKDLKDTDPVVLELSSWQCNSLKEIKRSPEMAIVTNMMVDHMNTYTNFDAYVRDKSYIFKFQHPWDVAIFNKDNGHTKAMSKQAPGRIYLYSLKPLAVQERGVFVNGRGEVVFQEDGHKEMLFSKKDIQLLGEHNISNVLAATCAAYLSGITPKHIQSVVKKFKGIDSRLEVIRTFKGRTFINDTTATTPDALCAALKSFTKKPILIMGGTDKKLDFSQLPKVLNTYKRIIFLPGTATDLITSRLQSSVEVIRVDSMRGAVLKAWEYSAKNDIILLSPGAASFGLFKNEFDRGDQFNHEVRKLQ
jgi:UDP-N-acetylmuramoylalanine--D-glutamate ligase